MALRIGVDVGGTFTDFAVEDTRTGEAISHKCPSTPREPHIAIISGLKAVLARNGHAASDVETLLHGTTVGTNALIQRLVGKVALVTSDGFRDLIEIGRQVRPNVYDIHRDFPEPVVRRDHRFEVPERMRADGEVHVPLDEKRLRGLVPGLLEQEVDCVVVCFLHSYAFPAHEQRAVEILREELPESVYVVASTDVYPEFREYERFTTAIINGSLLPVFDRYLNRLTDEVRALGLSTEPRISQSNGGLMSVGMARKLPIRASLSGPAAGVSAVVHWARLMDCRNVITLDIGGTSADVALIRDFTPREVPVQSIGGFPIRMPSVDVTAVGAGGGTVAWIDTDNLLKVGPMSAGADPGPACYDKGGTVATVTDANVCLGRLNATALLGGRMPINAELSRQAVGELAQALHLGFDETALGILRIAAATVVKALRKVSVERGLDPTEFTLFAFGGAGPLFAVDVAREIGISTVVIPRKPGLMCAEGLHHCTLTNDFVRSTLRLLDQEAGAEIRSISQSLSREADQWFTQEGVAPEIRMKTWSIDLRYCGQNFELTLPLDPDELIPGKPEALAAAFHDEHERAYGFASRAEPVELVSIKLKAAHTPVCRQASPMDSGSAGASVARRTVVFDQLRGVSTPVYARVELNPGQRLDGPAIVEQEDATSLIFPGDRARVDQWGNLIIELHDGTTRCA